LRTQKKVGRIERRIGTLREKMLGGGLRNRKKISEPLFAASLVGGGNQTEVGDRGSTFTESRMSSKGVGNPNQRKEKRERKEKGLVEDYERSSQIERKKSKEKAVRNGGCQRVFVARRGGRRERQTAKTVARPVPCFLE